MGRLIDATRLRTEVDLLLEKNLLRPTAMATMHNLIDAQPTAFNVEAVVNVVREAGANLCANKCCNNNCDCCVVDDALRTIIDAIRKGGVK